MAWTNKAKNAAPTATNKTRVRTSHYIVFQNGDKIKLQNGDILKTGDGAFDWTNKTKIAP